MRHFVYLPVSPTRFCNRVLHRSGRLRFRYPVPMFLLTLLALIVSLAQDGSTSVIPTAVETPHLRVATTSSASTMAAGGKVTLVAEVTPKPQMHVYSPEQHDYIPVSLQVTAPPGLTVGRPVFPKGETFVFAPTKERQIVFSKPFRIEVPLTASRSLKPGPIDLKGVLQYQACDDKVCYVPRKVEVRWVLKLQ